MAKIEAGTMLSFSGGEYSDKWTYGPFEVLVDLDQKDVSETYVAQYVPQHSWDKPDEHGFVAWLTLNNYIRDVPKSYNWYVGNYDFEPVVA